MHINYIKYAYSVNVKHRQICTLCTELSRKNYLFIFDVCFCTARASARRARTDDDSWLYRKVMNNWWRRALEVLAWIVHIITYSINARICIYTMTRRARIFCRVRCFNTQSLCIVFNGLARIYLMKKREHYTRWWLWFFFCIS